MDHRLWPLLALAACLGLAPGRSAAQWPPSLEYDPAPPGASVVPVWEPGQTRARRTTLDDLFAGLCPVTRAVNTTAPLAGGGALSGDLTLYIALSGTNRLLGRGSAGAGPVEEIALGSGLSISGGVLSAAGGVSSVTLAVPPWLQTSGSPGTGAVSIGVSPASGQAADEVVGTCGGATSVSLCALTASQLPVVPPSKGGTGQTAVTVDGVLVANGSTFDLKTLPGCTDGSGRHLNWDATTHTLSCGTSASYVLPAPTSSTLGGVKSLSATANNFVTGLGTDGVLTTGRPACGNLSDSTAACSGDASGLSAGTVPAGRLPTPTSSTLGGVKALAAVTHYFLNLIGTDGTPAAARPSCSDLLDAASTCSTAPAVFGAAGASHSSGLVPDTGSTVFAPVKVLGSDAAWHVAGPFMDRYSIDRRPPASTLDTSRSDEFLASLTLSYTLINGGDGLSFSYDRDTLLVKQTSGVSGTSTCRGGMISPPPSGDWLLCVKWENEQVTSSGAGPGQSGLAFGVGGTLSSPNSIEQIRFGGSITLDHANNGSGSGWGCASNVRASGSLPTGGYSVTPQFLVGAVRFTAATNKMESFYSVTGYRMVALGTVTLSSAITGQGFFLLANSTTIVPALRALWWREITDATRIANVDCGG